MLKRYILFIVLSFLVFWLYTLFFTPRRPTVKPTPVEEREAESEQPGQAKEAEKEGAPSEEPTRAQEVTPLPALATPTVNDEQRDKEEKVWLDNNYCRMFFTRYGGAVREVVLYTTQTNAKVVIQGKDPVSIPGRKVLEELNPLVITSRKGEGLDLSTQAFELKEKSDRKLSYELNLDKRFKVTKTFELAEEGYLLTLDIGFESVAEERVRVPAHQVKVGTTFPSDPKAGYRDISFMALGAGKPQRLSAKPNKAQNKSFSYLRWASVANKYFALILSPEPKRRDAGKTSVPVDKVIPDVGESSRLPGSAEKSSSKKDEEYFYSLGIGVEGFELKPGERIVHRYSFYAGPKEYDRLKRLSDKLAGDRQFERVMSLGWLGLGIPLLKILKLFYKTIPNYGVAIILLTVVIKIILYPLDQKSYKSMKEMQKLQPLIAEIKQKYKDDPRKAQTEQMKLFKEHKVNPMGGCLPMLLQMPVLIAMFGMIRSAIELRRAPFALWIKDLSEPDAVLDFGVTVPIIGHTLNILPLLLVLTFVLQNKVSRTGASSARQDPQQKMMGHMMTVIFGIIFYNMPSGLNLYFAVSTILRAVQQYFVQKKGESYKSNA